MAGFVSKDGAKTYGFTSGPADNVRKLSSFGMYYDDLIIQRRQGAGETETSQGSAGPLGHSVYGGYTSAQWDQRLLSAMAIQDIGGLKALAVYDSNYITKRDFLRSFSLNDEIVEILDTISDEAIVYDEKVSKSEVMVKQRSRWISSQFHYMKKYLPSGIVRLFKNQDFDYFNKSIQLAIPPRMFMVLIVFFGTILSVASHSNSIMYAWLILFSTYLMAFVIAFPRKFVGKQLFQLVIAIPNAFFKLVSSIPSMFHANKKFIHTPHES